MIVRSIRHLVTAMIFVALVLATPAPAVEAAPAGARVTSWPTHGALFGATIDLDSHTGTDRKTAWTKFETTVALRRLDVDRQFRRWDQPCATADDLWSVSLGRTLLVSLDARLLNNSYETWARIASGADDARLDECAKELNALGGTVEFSFQHEPETNTGALPGGAGTPTDYIAAYRHVVDRMRYDQLNARYVPIFMAITPRNGRMTTWYPGDAWVDGVGYDGYNWYGCVRPSGPWVTPSLVFAAAHNFALSRGKPMVIAEWGTGEDPATPGRKGQWITDLATMVKSWPSVVEVNIFDSGRNPNCPRYADTSASSLAAYRAMGADPYFHQVP